MAFQAKPSSLTKSKSSWIWKWDEAESELQVIPKSKTERLSKKAELANLDAEKALSRAYKAELARTKIISEAMFKSGKALKYTLVSIARELLLRTEASRRRFEPGFREN